MRRLLILFISSVVVSSLYADVKISFLSGPASVYKNQQWSDAAVGMSLATQDKIKTSPESKAVLVVDNTTRVWVSKNSEMEVSSLGEESTLGLLMGKLRAKVKLLAGRKFRVKTPVCVASVRGTEFAISSEGQLDVIEGRVEFADLGLEQAVEVTEGQRGTLDAGGKPASREMTNEEKQQVSQEWDGFEQQQGSNSGEQPEPGLDTAKLRQEIHDVVNDVKTDIGTTRELTNEIKESDMSAGRTLRDVHGNLVRVEQHLLRPDNQTLQMLNLTKRSDYTYKDNRNLGWGYHGPTGSRLDIMEVTIKMNMPLPEQITEWPSYISSKGDDMHPQTVEVKMSNKTDNNELRFSGEWKPKGYLPPGEDYPLKDDELVFDSYINGYMVDKTYKPENNLALPDSLRNGHNADGHDNGELWGWAISPQIRLLDKNGNPVEYVQLLTESYVINNDGKVLNLNDFTNSSENPFVLFKQVAGEQIVFCRKTSDNTDFFYNRGNLDLVVTPDLIVSVAEKLASQAGELNKDSNKDNNDNNNNNYLPQ